MVLKIGDKLMVEGRIKFVSLIKNSIINDNGGYPVYFSTGNYIWSDQIRDFQKVDSKIKAENNLKNK